MWQANIISQIKANCNISRLASDLLAPYVATETSTFNFWQGAWEKVPSQK